MSPEIQPAAPARTRPRRADAERNREAILAAAQRLFEEQGADVPLDVIAKAATVANATLYRHFPTRAELLVAVYSDEVAELDALGRQLMNDPDAGRAFTDWLRAFMHHVATKRDLALAIPDEPGGDRTTLFAEWHRSMHSTAQRLLTRGQDAQSVRPNVTVRHLLALASAIALTGHSRADLDAMLDLARDGYRSAGSTPAP
jgi:AcrR family transcriptional regulator